MPSLLLSEEAIGALDATLQESDHFRKDLAAVSAKEPPTTTSAVGDMASWFLEHVVELRRVKQAQAAKTSGDIHPSKPLGTRRHQS